MRTRFQLGVTLALTGALSACGPSRASEAAAAGGPSPVSVVAVEGVYADIARQIASDGFRVSALQHGVDADPHAYEPTPSDAAAVGAAGVVVRNGAGYDAFVDKLLDASPSDARTVLDVASLARLPRGGNPHLWYDIDADRTLAAALANEFVRRRPAERAKIAVRERAFSRALDRWDAQMRALAARDGGAIVATTEPVFDDVLERARIATATPRSFSLAIEQGNDPAPQDVATLDALVPGGVRALVVNAQTVAPSTSRLVARAKAAALPIVEVSESLPDGVRAQTWFESETRALAAALATPHPSGR